MTDQTQTGQTGQTTTEGSADQTQNPGSNKGATNNGGRSGAASTAGEGASTSVAATGAKVAGTTDQPFYEAWTDAKLKESPVILRHKTTEDMARSLVAAESRLGVPAEQLLKLPSKPEEFADLYKRLGAPESADGYKITLPEGASDEDRAAGARFAAHMHAKGPFPPDVVQAAVDYWNGETAAADAARTTAETTRRSEAETLLKTELGAKFDPEMKAIGKLLTDLGGADLAKELDASGMGDNPRLLLALHKVVDKLGESQSLDGQGRPAAGAGAMTPGQAKAARINLENDPVKSPALHDKSHAMHQTVLDERNRLLAFEAGQNPA